MKRKDIIELLEDLSNSIDIEDMERLCVINSNDLSEILDKLQHGEKIN